MVAEYFFKEPYTNEGALEKDIALQQAVAIFLFVAAISNNELVAPSTVTSTQ